MSDPKEELRELGRDVAGQATRTLTGRFVDWLRELVQRRRATKKRQQK